MSSSTIEITLPSAAELTTVNVAQTSVSNRTKRSPFYNAACCLLLAGFTLNINAAQATEQRVFYGASNEMPWLYPVKIRHMSNEQLLYSAEQMRKNAMPVTQRVFNYYWLMQDSSQMIYGGRALGKLLRFSWAQYRQNRRSFTYDQNIENDSWFFETGAFLTQWGDYKMRVSEKKVAIKFSAPF